MRETERQRRETKIDRARETDTENEEETGRRVNVPNQDDKVFNITGCNLQSGEHGIWRRPHTVLLPLQDQCVYLRFLEGLILIHGTGTSPEQHPSAFVSWHLSSGCTSSTGTCSGCGQYARSWPGKVRHVRVTGSCETPPSSARPLAERYRRSRGDSTVKSAPMVS